MVAEAKDIGAIYKFISNILIMVLIAIASIAGTMLVLKTQEINNNRVSLAEVKTMISALTHMVEVNDAAQDADILALQAEIAELKTAVRGYANKTGRIRNVQDELLERFNALEKAFHSLKSNSVKDAY